MIQRQLKLKLTCKQKKTLNEWLWYLTGVHNWAVRKIELDAKDGIYYSNFSFKNLLANHGKKIGIPGHVLQGSLKTVYLAWDMCFKKISKRPRLKGQRNKLNSILFPDPIKITTYNRIRLPGIGSIRFYKQEIPNGKIKCCRVIKRASGWYLCLFINAEPNEIQVINDGEVGIDPGYKNLLTLSTGEKIEHPKELQKVFSRIGQAQRGKNKKLTARLHERVKNKRKDRNHKISRRLVSENKLIVFSKDNLRVLSRAGFGKSVTASAHGQLRSMLTYKSNLCGREYIEVSPNGSTMTCSACGQKTGPTGRAGLKVRQWVCPCGAEHDRDVNAAINTLLSGLERPTRAA